MSAVLLRHLRRHVKECVILRERKDTSTSVKPKDLLMMMSVSLSVEILQKALTAQAALSSAISVVSSELEIRRGSMWK